MRIIVSPIGSAGDVHPLVGLATSLKLRGHEVTVLTSGYFNELLERRGLDHVELGTKEDFLRLANDPHLWHPYRAFPHICRHGISQILRDQYRAIEERMVPGETVVISSCLGFGARIAQEKLGVPLVTAHLQPAPLWSDYDSPKLPGMLMGPGIPRWVKRWQFRLGETLIIDRVVREVTTTFRRELGLPPIRRTTDWWHSPQLVMCLFPEWYGPRQPDWPANLVHTEFPLWDDGAGTVTPEAVARFLGNGDPPLVFTPGSAMMYGEAFFRAAVEACQRLGRRGILLSSFNSHIPASLPESIRHFEYVPFSNVLPHAAGIVHHGGIGTTAQGLAAGIPQLVMPMAHDQFDNAARLKRFGVGDWLNRASFSGPAVSQRLQGLLDSADVRHQCTQLASRFSRDHRAEAACDLIEHLDR